MTKTWDEIFKSGRRWNRYPPEELVRFCSDLPKGVVYDFGCGPGAGPSWYLAREGWRYFGHDTSEAAIEATRKRFGEEGVEGFWTVEPALQSAGMYDLVIDIQSLQHVEDPKPVIDNLYRILKPGGRIFSMWATHSCSRTPYLEFGYTNFISFPELRDLFERFDIEIERSGRSHRGQYISHHILTGTKCA